MIDWIWHGWIVKSIYFKIKNTRTSSTTSTSSNMIQLLLRRIWIRKSFKRVLLHYDRTIPFTILLLLTIPTTSGEMSTIRNASSLLDTIPFPNYEVQVPLPQALITLVLVHTRHFTQHPTKIINPTLQTIPIRHSTTSKLITSLPPTTLPTTTLRPQLHPHPNETFFNKYWIQLMGVTMM